MYNYFQKLDVGSKIKIMDSTLPQWDLDQMRMEHRNRTKDLLEGHLVNWRKRNVLSCPRRT